MTEDAGGFEELAAEDVDVAEETSGSEDTGCENPSSDHGSSSVAGFRPPYLLYQACG